MLPKDIDATDHKENDHENNLMTFSFEAEPQTKLLIKGRYSYPLPPTNNSLTKYD